MSKLIIEKFTNSHMRVYSDDFGLEQEISDYFMYEVSGAKFMPAFKSGAWDGFVRLYNRQKKTLYTGLFNILINFCDNNEIEYQTDFELIPSNDDRVPEDDIVEFVDSLQIAKSGVELTVRDYQMESIVKAIQDKRITLLSPTSSGKSAMMYCIARWYMEQGKKVLIIVPNQGLVNQMYADFEDYSSVNGWEVHDYVQKIMSGFTKDDTHQCKISTWQSLLPIANGKDKKFKPAYLNNFDAVLFDEVHLATGKSSQDIMDKCLSADCRVGLTGTIDNKTLNRTTITGIFGPIHQVTTTKELMDLGSVTQLKISAVLLKYSKEESKLLKGLKYQQEIKYLIESDRRNNFIAKTALATKGNTLILFQFISHGKKLYDMISKMTDRPVFYISGEVKADKREQMRTDLNNYKDAILIASVQTTSTGVNIPSLDNVIFASPTKSIYRVLQSIGRVLRLKDGKIFARLIDIGDKMSTGKTLNTTCRHFIERIKIYTQEKFSFKITELDF